MLMEREKWFIYLLRINRMARSPKFGRFRISVLFMLTSFTRRYGR